MIYKFKQIVLEWIYVDDICTICDDKLSLYKGECYSDCPTGFFKNGNICEQCEPYCLSCNGLGQCSKYQENLVLYNDQYIKESQFGFRNNERNVCVIIIKWRILSCQNVIILYLFYII